MILLLIVMMRRGRGGGGKAAAPPRGPRLVMTSSSGGSWLDEPVGAGFEGLGKPVTADAPTAARPPVAPPTPDPPPTASWQEPPSQAAPAAAPVPPAAVPAAPAAPVAPVEGAAHLSDIMVTTTEAEIDLSDPDVRALLEELADDEIRLAEDLRSQGSTLDAILQLTEAEKACQALGDEERADKVRAMMKELQP